MFISDIQQIRNILGNIYGQ